MAIYLGFNRVKNIYLYTAIVDVHLRGLVDRSTLNLPHTACKPPKCLRLTN